MKYNSGVAKRPAIFVSSTCYNLKVLEGSDHNVVNLSST